MTRVHCLLRQSYCYPPSFRLHPTIQMAEMNTRIWNSPCVPQNLFVSPRPLFFSKFLPPKHASTNAFLSFKKILSAPETTTTTTSTSSVSSNSQDFHLVSTTEYPDGSFVFRFGEESEVASSSNLEMEEPNTEMVLETRELVVDSKSNGVDDNDVSAETETISYKILTPAEPTDSKLDMVSREEIATQSAASQEENDCTTGNNLINGGDSDKDDAVQTVSESSASDEQSISSTVVGNDGIESLKLLDGNVTSSILEEEIAECDAQHSSDVEISSIAGESQIAGTTIINEEISVTRFFLSSGAVLLPLSSEALAGREDAYFVDQNWLAIADGVGQWSLEGINTRSHAQELIENCQKIVSDRENIPIVDPVEVLRKGALETKSPGSSTALVSYFDGQALHVANIGDSGFLVIRNGTVFRRSSPMFHEFHFPLQIERGDDPSDIVQVYKTNMEDADIVVIATDGLFDNLYEQQIVSIVSKSSQACLKPQEIAELLAKRAHEVGKSASARSPFADAAQAAGYVGYIGGKLDNVTVIVSLVKNISTIPAHGV